MSRLLQRWGALALAAALAGCDGETSVERGDGQALAGPPWFREVGRQAGLDFRHQTGTERRYWFPEIMGGGVAFLDHDGNGTLDLYLVQSGDLASQGTDQRAGNVLYSNDGQGAFSDVTQTAGVGDRGYGMGVACGDYDGDGDTDLYVTNLGPNGLYRNEGGGRFVDVSAASGTDDGRWGTSTVFLDHDRDGDLDLFVVNYVNWSPEREVDCRSTYGRRDYCSPNNFNAPAADVLYRNDGASRFQDVTEASDIAGDFGNGLGVASGDFDGNGYADLYVANDLMPNQLWLNAGDGTFRDEALLSGCAVNMDGVAEAGMGAVALDHQDDGDLDLFLTHLRDQSNTLYLNEGGSFVDQTVLQGLSGPSLPYTGFGTGFADFDQDGQLDLFVANGSVAESSAPFDLENVYAEPNQLFRGLSDGRFEEVPRAGLASPLLDNSRGVAFGDYDGDGDVDLAVLDNGSSVKLLENLAGDGRHGVQLLVHEANGALAVGAMVRVGEGENARWRQVQPGYGYCSSNDPRVHVGLGSEAGSVPVLVRWPDGTLESFGAVEPDRVHVLRRGGGTGGR